MWQPYYFFPDNLILIFSGQHSFSCWVLVLLFHFFTFSLHIWVPCFTFSLFHFIFGSLFYFTSDHVVTSRIPFDATAQQVKDALEALSNIGQGGLLRVERNQGKVPRLFKAHMNDD